MTITEREGVFTYVDDTGNELQMYPDVKTDKTLSVSDKPADAAVVGTKLSGVETNLTGVNTKLNSVLYIVSFNSSTGTLVTKSADYTG